jgi:hypothetical protein
MYTLCTFDYVHLTSLFILIAMNEKQNSKVISYIQS